MRTVEVDFDIHKLIEMERRGFEDSPNAALRRLLGLPDANEIGEAPMRHGEGRGWRSGEVHLPSGTELRMTYGGRTHVGVVDGESWAVEGKRYNSASGAASGVALTKAGKHPRLDGWMYWEAKFPGSLEWLRLSDLRARALRLRDTN